MKLTYFGANSWLLEFADLCILIDPWLVETLTFGGQGWFFEGTHTAPPTIPATIDLILLSQGLPDHSHPPTLQQLDRHIPVVASASAAKVAKKLGYSQVTTLKPGEQTVQGKDRLAITATAGAPVPQVENGYILRDRTTHQSLYYEPHGFSESSLAEHSPIDVVITPIVNLALPLAGAFIHGNERTVALLKTLQARYILPTAAGEGVKYAGLIEKVLQVEGGPVDFRSQLQQADSQAQLIEPVINQAIAINL